MTYTNWIRASRRAASLIVAALFAVGLAACGDGPTSGETTSLSLQLTDHPSGDVQAAWLQVDSVEFQGSGGGVVVMDEPSGFIRVSDLQAVEDEFEPLVEDVEVPSGSYGQVRVFIGGAAVQSGADGDIFTFGDVPSGITSLDGDGQTEELIVPSITETGIKAILADEAVRLEGTQKVLAIDFDVSQSFGIQAGASGSWVMHPVMRVLDLEVTGRIEGNLIDEQEPTISSFPTCGDGETGLEDFVPLAANTVTPEDTASGVVDADGSYAILTSASTYEMTFADTVEFDNGDRLLWTASVVGDGTVELEEGAVETVDYELDEAICEASS
jgi:hypothetical protein